MSTIKFRVAAKTDIGLVRTNNEDNFQVAADLSAGNMRWVNNEICSLGTKGTLLVVADGMGGMNAGEVASALAIETVRERFEPQKLTPDVLKSRFTIEKYLNDTIIAADARIKAEAKTHPEARGMGTTMVIAWALDGNLYVSWCGDSRAYIYNPAAGLHQITKDHSYVQSLVDKGAISREDAFDYPDSNIITRSLSDSPTKAKPETLLKPYKLCDNDIVLLCTDGLNGMIRDNEIEAVIRKNEHDMSVLVDELIHAACDAEGSDNVTICICQILQGAGPSDPQAFEAYDSRLRGKQRNAPMAHTVITADNTTKPKSKTWVLASAALALLLAGGAGGWLLFGRAGEKAKDEQEKPEQGNDSKQMAADTVRLTTSPAFSPAENEAEVDDKAATRGSGTQQPSHNGNDTGAMNRLKDFGKSIKESTNDDLTPIDNKARQGNDSGVQATDGEASAYIYIVQEGDNLQNIANRFGISKEEIKKQNGIKDENKINVGDTIRIKRKGQPHDNKK